MLTFKSFNFLIVFFLLFKISAQENRKIDNLIRLAPLSIYSTQLSFKDKNELKKEFLEIGISGLITSSSIFLLKNISNVTRPNGFDNRSFPSGHAGISFLGAELLRKKSPENKILWISAYLLSSYVSVKQVHSNYHRPVDVVSGALIGIFSVKLSEIILDKLKF